MLLGCFRPSSIFSGIQFLEVTHDLDLPLHEFLRL